jgi:hypothetical protein
VAFVVCCTTTAIRGVIFGCTIMALGSIIFGLTAMGISGNVLPSSATPLWQYVALSSVMMS